MKKKKQTSKQETASISLKKMITMAIVFIVLVGTMSVMASNIKLNNVTIVLSNGYEMKVLTQKTKISEILEENRVQIEEDEKSIPAIEDELLDNKTIKIIKKDEEVGLADEETQDIQNIMDSYNTITEKVVTVQEEIPFETITKDISNGSDSKQNKVVTEGQNGIKEVTYRIKYQNEIEIEKKEISSKIIKEPINKVVEVKTKVVTNRSTSRDTETNNSSESQSTPTGTKIAKTFNISAYCACSKCCGKSTGRTSSGAKAQQGVTIAAGSIYAYGTKIEIPGYGTYTVQDRGGAIGPNKIDIYFSSHAEALRFGRKNITCYVYK